MSLTPGQRFWTSIVMLLGVGSGLRFLSQSRAKAINGDQAELTAFQEIRRGLGEAFLIAGIVTAIVDPYLKFKLGEETGKEIARETMGQHLPPELRQAVEMLQEVRLYLCHMRIDIELERWADDPKLVVWRTMLRYQVKNASSHAQYYTHKASICDSSAEKPGKIVECCHYLDGKPEYRLSEGDRAFTTMCKKVDSGTEFSYSSSAKIPSDRYGKSEHHEFVSITERLVPENELQVVLVQLPTTNIDMTIKFPENFRIESSIEYVDGVIPTCPDGGRKGKALQWNAAKAYLPNQHISTHYFLKSPQQFLEM